MAKPSMARQRIMEEERQRAVEAYRHLKKQQQQQQHEAKNFSQAKKRTISDVWHHSVSGLAFFALDSRVDELLNVR